MLVLLKVCFMHAAQQCCVLCWCVPTLPSSVMMESSRFLYSPLRWRCSARPSRSYAPPGDSNTQGEQMRTGAAGSCCGSSLSQPSWHGGQLALLRHPALIACTVLC